MRWDEMRWDEMRWDEMRWDEMRWDDVGWHEMRWDDTRWDKKIWDEMNWGEMIWDKVRWYNVIWYDTMWYEINWHDIIWYDLTSCNIWYPMISYFGLTMIWTDLIREWISHDYILFLSEPQDPTKSLYLLIFDDNDSIHSLVILGLFIAYYSPLWESL